MSYCPERPCVQQRLTVEENMRLIARVASCDAHEIEAQLRAFGLLQYRSEVVETLDYGVQRRASMAAASLGPLAVLLVDSPTEGQSLSVRLCLVGSVWIIGRGVGERGREKE
jgi:ABC-type multidrug transport system ATPase subunit